MDIPIPRADVHAVAAFQNLSGTSAPFSLPYGFYWVDFDAADPNAGTTVAVLDSGGNTLVTVGQNTRGFILGGPLGGGGFQVGPSNGASMTMVASNGIAQSIVVQG